MTDLSSHLRILLETNTCHQSDQPASSDCRLADVHKIISETYPCTEAQILAVNGREGRLHDDGSIQLVYRKFVPVTKERALAKFIAMFVSERSYDFKFYHGQFKVVFPQFDIGVEEFTVEVNKYRSLG